MQLLKNVIGLALLGCLTISSAQAALILDRTRVIYDEGAQSVSVGVTNKSNKDPYIAQSWIEDSNGKKVTTPFIVLPPLERIEAGDKTLIRVTLLPDSVLPRDKESVFYLNIREIPPKSDKVNTLQIALHSKLKLFYRPKAVIPARGDNTASHLKIAVQGKNLSINNPTALHVTLVSITAGSKNTPLKFEPIMMSPGQSITVPYAGESNTRLTVSHMNDYGGQQQSLFNCAAGSCTFSEKPRSS